MSKTRSTGKGLNLMSRQVREVFKNILPNILMSSEPTYATVPAHKLATRERALAFVTYVLHTQSKLWCVFDLLVATWVVTLQTTSRKWRAASAGNQVNLAQRRHGLL
jgi:hypothetical protein